MKPTDSEGAVRSWERLALLVAGLTVLGSLALSLGMGLRACPLCFYQRSFAMAVVLVLKVGWLLRLPVPPGTLSLLALPLSLSGLGVAGVHASLVWTGVLACPDGILGLGTAPEQSLVAFAALTACLLPGAVRPGLAAAAPALRLAGLAVFAAAVAALSVVSSPPLPPYRPTFDAEGRRVLLSCERAAPESDPAPAPAAP